MILQGQVGPTINSDGAFPNVRQGKLGDIINSELHGRFYEQAYRGNLFSGGMTVTSINNATFTTGTLGATCTPIAGVWNPGTSTVNLVILQAVMSVIMTALQATGAGAFVWASSTGNNSISTGGIPWNRKTLAQSGSQAKNMAGVALTGLSNNLVVMHASQLDGGSAYNIALLATAAGFQPSAIASVENIDGSIIVPPGGVLALLATTTPVAHSAATSLLWEEVPV